MLNLLLKQNNKSGNSDDLLTEEEACKMLNIALPTLRTWKCKGKIPFYRPEGSGRTSFFKRSELLKFMSGVRHKSNSEIVAEAEAYCAIKRTK